MQQDCGTNTSPALPATAGRAEPPANTRARVQGSHLLFVATLVFALLCLAAFAPRPAGAQGPADSVSDSASGGDIWAATLRVANHRGMLGYNSVPGRTTGELSLDRFSWRGVEYRVHNLLVNRSSRDSGSWRVLIAVSPALPADVGAISLRLGNLWLNLTNARGNRLVYYWRGLEPSWNSGQRVQVGLRVFQDEFEPRSIDGYGNNPINPVLGQANTPFLRLAGVSFEYGLSARISEHPAPRDISNILLAQSELIPSAVEVTDMFWQWGQFLDHDMTLTLENVDEQKSIAVPLGDPMFDPLRRGDQAIEFNRSQFRAGTGTGLDNPRAQVNELTAFLDASNVYGSSLLRSRALRTNDGSGRLKTSGDGRFMPYNIDRLFNENGNVPRSRHRELFLAGDIRANEQVGLISIQTLFVREHNRLAEEIAEEQPGLNGQEIFELARKIVGAQVQAITFHEFLPLLLGPGAIEPYRGYDSLVDPSIAMEFSTAAFRIGHTLLSPTLTHIDADGETQKVSLAEAFFRPSVVTDLGISGFLRGLSTQTAQQVDAKVVDQIRNLLFGVPGGPGRDLASLNIQRGRDHGVPSYNHVRGAYGLPPAETFSDISSDPAVQDQLRRAYGDVDLVDLWPGGLAEDHVPGANVGETFRTIIADQFRRLRDGDRFWYERDPYFLANADLLQEVRSTTLADIIRRNTAIGDELPDVVFGGLTPTVAIAASASEVEEGAEISFTLTRTGTTSKELIVELDIEESGGVLEVPVEKAPYQATFEMGQQSATFTLSTIDDLAVEFDGAIEASIVEASGFDVVAGDRAATVDVLDNDSEEILLERGFNLIEWTGPDRVGVRDALRVNGGPEDISERIVAVYEWNDLNQRWYGYFPALDHDSTINNLNEFRTGSVYWIDASVPLRWRVPKADQAGEN